MDFDIPVLVSEKLSKQEIYDALPPLIDFSFDRESDRIANLANTAAILKSTSLPFFWIGFYLVKGGELVLGPFQGLPATSRIAYGSGVCGTSWKERKSLLVPDVHQFEGYIACNGLALSEIVVPIFSAGEVVAVLDIESQRLNDFDDIDQRCLEEIAGVIGSHWKTQKQ